MTKMKKSMRGNKTIRRGQLISPFGVGSMIDFPKDTLMVAGLDMWPDHEALRILPNDSRFAKKMGVRDFRTPPAMESDVYDNLRVPLVRFPRWYQCKKCGLLSQAGLYDSRPPHCENMITFGKYNPCGARPVRDRPRLVPMRFVIACQNGHIDDFPWITWAHSGTSDKVNLQEITPCKDPLIRVYNMGIGSGLNNLVVQCVNCNKSRSMAGASNFDKLPGCNCEGRRPWLGINATEPNCNEKPKLVQRGGSNVYFPRTSSSILIPPYSNKAWKVIDNPSVWDLVSEALIDGKPSDRLIGKLSTRYGLEPDKLREVVMLKHAGEIEPSSKQNIVDDEEYRRQEFNVLRLGRSESDSELELASPALSRFESFIGEFFETVVLVEKVAETRCLSGFDRISPRSDDGSSVSTVLSLHPISWLPAVRVYGEGIFLAFCDKRIEEWSSQSSVQNRWRVLMDSYRKVGEERGFEPRPLSPAFLMLHTFAHLLILQLSFDCGYGAASVRERLYCSSEGSSEPMTGVLLYTSQGDSEGTLGGLVDQATPGRLERLIKGAIEKARWCSSDPLCIESPGQGTDSLNLAACHTCALLPETSCEEGNRLLDRALLVGTPDDPKLGFLHALL